MYASWGDSVSASGVTGHVHLCVEQNAHCVLWRLYAHLTHVSDTLQVCTSPLAVSIQHFIAPPIFLFQNDCDAAQRIVRKYF